MNTSTSRTLSVRAALVASLVPALATAQQRGPSSSQDPYLRPVAAGVKTVSILTVGDSPQGSTYRMVGIPDGLGAARRFGSSFDLFMNHELTATAGVVRAHGQTGAFVSHWEIRRSDLTVLSGEDLIHSATITSGSPAFSRFCSGDLPKSSAFFPFDPFAPLLYMNGEETGNEGRAFAHIGSGPDKGQSFELPALGKLSFENSVARPFPSFRTVVASMDDTTPGQVYFYLGVKRFSSNPIERAGLTGGSLYGVRIPGVALEDRVTVLGGATRFELAALGDVSAKTGTQLQADSVAAGVTEFLRPEDGTWHQTDPRLFYFVTTDRFNQPGQDGRSRLWQLRFDNPFVPEFGGTITLLLDGTEGQQMLDNMTIDRHGNLLLQEDPGNQAHIARIWQYTPASDTLKLIAEHDPRFFQSGSPEFLTQDEESSGIIDASDVLGRGWFLLDQQAHYAIAGELVEGGQLLALYNPDSK